MNRKHIVLLSTITLALMTVGIAYAHWTDHLYVNFEIDTGELHLTPDYSPYWISEIGEWRSVSFDDHSTLVMDSGPYAGYGKEWAIPEGYILTGADSHEVNWFDIHLHNVYPCLTATMELELYNDGTIPAGFNGYYLDYLVGGELGGVLSPIDPYSDFIIDPIDMDFDPDGYVEFYVYDTDPDTWDYPICEVSVQLTADTAFEEWSDQYPNSWEQIDPGYSVYAEITIHFNESLPQDHEYEFYFRLFYVNWNEVGATNDLSLGAGTPP